MKDKKKGVLLDLDGTLWDSSKAVVKAWNEILEKYGLEPLSDEDMKRVMGLSMNRIADILFPNLEPEKRYALMRECELHENEYIRRHGGVLLKGPLPCLPACQSITLQLSFPIVRKAISKRSYNITGWENTSMRPGHTAIFKKKRTKISRMS